MVGSDLALCKSKRLSTTTSVFKISIQAKLLTCEPGQWNVSENLLAADASPRPGGEWQEELEQFCRVVSQPSVRHEAIRVLKDPFITQQSARRYTDNCLLTC